LIFNVKYSIQSNTLPNFHGWSAEEVMAYDKEHENITVIYELVYSYDILQNRVMEQSIKPRTVIGKDPLVLTVTVSKGAPVMDDFTGKSVSKLMEFANEHDLIVVSTEGSDEVEKRSGNQVISQSVLMGETLKKGEKIQVTLN
ncbi:PASTA domain-containing protein, partial [Turicibacter sanguinis]|nr:PASTA domain-containing protein [Turicibacter sanguinis]